MFVHNVLSQVSSKVTSPFDAVTILSKGMSREQLAEFIVDALERGWIDRRAMGLPEPKVNTSKATTNALKASKVSEVEYSLDM